MLLNNAIKKQDEDDETITLMLETVSAVSSKGYEAKDLEIAQSSYLSQA